MVDLSPTDRLVRKRNNILQKQLDVTLQILGEEYRQTKERMYKEERDCGKFLQSLYNTVPGLTTYGQPDTRAMNSNALLKERRYSIAVSVLSGSGPHNHLDPPFRPVKARTPADNPGRAAGDHHSRPKSSKHDDCGAKLGAREDIGSAAEGGSKQTVSGRGSPAKRLGETGNFNGNFPVHRPSTAVQLRSAPSPVPDSSPEKASSACLGHNSPRYGRSAYSEHERFVQDRVRKRFDVIFDPATENRKVNLSTLATPIVTMRPDDDSDSASKEDRTHASARNPHVSVIKVNGEEFHLARNPTAHRRVVWSARPHRGQQAEFAAPNSARAERPKSEIPSTTARPRLKSSSLRAMSLRNKSPTVSAAPGRPPSGRPASYVHLQSPQKNLPAKSSGHETVSECSSESNMDEQNPSTVKLKHEMPKEPTAPATPVERFKKQPCARQEPANGKSFCIVQGNLSHQVAQQSRQPEPNQRPCGPSNLLQVPGSQQQQPLHVPNSTDPNPDPGRKSAAQRPSSRLSNSSDRTPPVELWSKLMKAGLSAAGRANNKRPKTAPSKSELSHRSMPAPRQTVVGILAQIENQKANTRNMINTSKDLQRVVKKLVPWEQRQDVDDWLCKDT